MTQKPMTPTNPTEQKTPTMTLFWRGIDMKRAGYAPSYIESELRWIAEEYAPHITPDALNRVIRRVLG